MLAHLDAIKDTHNVEPLPAYDVDDTLIHPYYEATLAGAITQVCFSLVHFIIKQKHISNAMIWDITVLHLPITIMHSSLKHIFHPQKTHSMTG